MSIKQALTGLVCVLAASLCSAGASAGSVFPNQPIRFVVGFPPGGSTDIVARILAEGLTKELKQTVVVENKAGAGGAVAAGSVANAKPDGYTIFLGTVATNVINPLLRKNLSFDPIKDFSMIGEVGFYTNLVLVNAASEYKTLNQLVEAGKKQSKSFSTPGAGTSPHMTGEYFQLLSGMELQHIPFSGSGPALTALMGGHVDMAFDNLPAALGLVQAGKINALAITSTQRIKQLPDVPTADELGIKGMSVDAWVSVMGPANIPADRVAVLSDALISVLNNPDIVSKLEANAITIKATRPHELQAYIEAETKKWSEVVQKSGVSVE